jgi:type II secretory pathway pseudopilin PulG
MRRRRLVFAAVLIATALPGAMPSLAASVDSTSNETATVDQRFLLSCTGAMATDGRAPDRNDTADRIVATAVVDLTTQRISGFGIGSAPIVVSTPAMIGFGNGGVDTLTLAAETARPPGAKTGTLVEGSFDRLSGVTTVVVHPASEPERVLIAMRLDCRIVPAPG